MAGVKISNLPVTVSLDGTEIVPIVDGGVTRRTTITDILNVGGGGGTDLTDYDGAVVSITATSATGMELISSAANGIVDIQATGTDGLVNIQGDGIEIASTGDEGNVDIQAQGADGNVRLFGPSQINNIIVDANGISIAGNDDNIDGVSIRAGGEDGVVFIEADTTVEIIASGTGGLVTIEADDSITLTGFVKASKQIYPATDALAFQTASGLLAGTGVPNNANGNNGDFYFRSDGGAGTCIYQRRAGTWVATGA